MTAMLTGPGVARAVAAGHAETLRRMVAGLAMLSREIVRLKAEVSDRDEKIATLQGIVERAYVDTERPSP